MNVITREIRTYQDIGEPKVRFGAGMRKRSHYAGHRVCLILTLIGLTCGLPALFLEPASSRSNRNSAGEESELGLYW